MRSVLLTIAYDGTDFFGWQFQAGRRTVQHVMELAVQEVTGMATRVCGSSRTDTGVHAIGQAASLRTESPLDNLALRRALNAVLPDDVVVKDAVDAPLYFNATRDSIAKRYRYVIRDGRIRDPLGARYSWYVPVALDVAAMEEAGKYLLGEHDFKAFQSTGSARQSSVRTIYDVTVERKAMDYGERIIVEVEANGFLYSMVRNIVGSLMFVGRGKYPPSWIGEALATRDRREAGMAAPPEGLFLMWVEFGAGEGSATSTEDDDESPAME